MPAEARAGSSGVGSQSSARLAGCGVRSTYAPKSNKRCSCRVSTVSPSIIALLCVWPCASFEDLIGRLHQNAAVENVLVPLGSLEDKRGASVDVYIHPSCRPSPGYLRQSRPQAQHPEPHLEDPSYWNARLRGLQRPYAARARCAAFSSLHANAGVFCSMTSSPSTPPSIPSVAGRLTPA